MNPIAHRRIASCWLLAVVLATQTAVAAPVAADAYRSGYEKTLSENGIEPSGAGVVAFLRKMLPDPNQQQQIASLIRQLGDDQFSQREAATAQLLQMPAVPVAALSAAADGGDIEIRWRARKVLRLAEDRSGNLLLAALKILTYEKTAGAADEILAVLPFCRKSYLLVAAHEALEAVAGPNDVELLRNKLQADDRRLRLAAAIGLAGALPQDHLAELHPLLDDADDHVALEVARAVANSGDRKALAVLVRLLESADPLVRSESVWLLQGLTGQYLGFASYDQPQKRTAAVAAWQAWVASHGPTAELQFPVAKQRSARGNLHGNTLIATGSGNRVYEMDTAGKAVWSYQIDAWSAEKLQNGNVLIGSYTSSKVIEVDAQGEVVWSFPSINAMTAKPLPGGNILVADFSGKRVAEINRKKSVVWEYKTPDECFDADRLPNGNTIFGSPNLVREVSPDHKVINEWKIQGRLNGLQALPGGNILVANYGLNKVYELTPQGETVWEFSEPQPCDVFRLPDGKTLITTATRVIEVAPDGKTARELGKSQYGSARR